MLFGHKENTFEFVSAMIKHKKLILTCTITLHEEHDLIHKPMLFNYKLYYELSKLL